MKSIFMELKVFKISILMTLEALDFKFDKFLQSFRAEFCPKPEVRASKLSKWQFLSQSLPNSTQNLSSRKILQFSHCVQLGLK